MRISQKRCLRRMKCEAWKGKSKIGNLLCRVWRDLSKKVGGMLNVVQHLHCARCLGQIIIVNRKWRNFDCLALEFSHSHSFDANLIHAQAIYHFLLRCTNVLLSFTQMKQLHCHRVGENSTKKKAIQGVWNDDSFFFISNDFLFACMWEGGET